MGVCRPLLMMIDNITLKTDKKENNMAKRMVTRTIKTTTLTLLCVDIDTQESCNRTVNITGEHTTDEKGVLKLVSARLPDNIKAVSVVSAECKESLYGMDENDFIRLSDPLPSRGANTENTNND